MTSPVQDYEPFENEENLFGDESQADPIDDEEGEELFGDNMEKCVINSLVLFFWILQRNILVIIARCQLWIITMQEI